MAQSETPFDIADLLNTTEPQPTTDPTVVESQPQGQQTFSTDDFAKKVAEEMARISSDHQDVDISLDGLEYLDPDSAKELKAKVLDPMRAREQEKYNQLAEENKLIRAELEALKKNTTAIANDVTHTKQQNKSAMVTAEIEGLLPDVNIRELSSSTEFGEFLNKPVSAASKLFTQRDLFSSFISQGDSGAAADLIKQYLESKQDVSTIASVSTSTAIPQAPVNTGNDTDIPTAIANLKKEFKSGKLTQAEYLAKLKQI